MKINIIGRKVNLRNNFKELAEKKLAKFDRIFDQDAEATVTVTVERNHPPAGGDLPRGEYRHGYERGPGPLRVRFGPPDAPQ